MLEDKTEPDVIFGEANRTMNAFRNDWCAENLFSHLNVQI